MAIGLTNSNEVKTAQTWLQRNGFKGIGGSDLVVDGVIGKNTKNAIMEAQKYLRDLGLYKGAIDGIAGQQTIDAMNDYSNRRSQIADIVNTGQNSSPNVTTSRVTNPSVRVNAALVRSLKGDDYGVSDEFLVERNKDWEATQPDLNSYSLPSSSLSVSYNAPTVVGSEIQKRMDQAKTAVAGGSGTTTPGTTASKSNTNTSSSGTGVTPKTNTPKKSNTAFNLISSMAAERATERAAASNNSEVLDQVVGAGVNMEPLKDFSRWVSGNTKKQVEKRRLEGLKSHEYPLDFGSGD